MNGLVAGLAHKVIPAVPVPLKRNREIDWGAQSSYVDWMWGQEIGGIAVWAHTGRGLKLTPEQRRAVLEAWCKRAGDRIVICGVGSGRDSYPDDTLKRSDAVISDVREMATAAREGGADALLVYPPAALAGLTDQDDRIIEVHRAAAASGLPVIAFLLYEEAGGIAYTTEVVERLLDLDPVIGIKVATLDSVVKFQEVASLVRQCTGKLLITGEDRFLGYSLMMGADAALIGMAAACTDLMVRLLDAWFEGACREFVALSRKIDDFASSTFGDPVQGYVRRMLWALEEEGVINGETDDPFGPTLTASDRRRLARAVEELRHDNPA